MTIQDAINIINPSTTQEALAPYVDCYTRCAVFEEACRIAVGIMRKAERDMIRSPAAWTREN